MSQLLKTAVLEKHENWQHAFEAPYTRAESGVNHDELDLVITLCEPDVVGLEIEEAINVVEARFWDEWDATLDEWIALAYPYPDPF